MSLFQVSCGPNEVCELPNSAPVAVQMVSEDLKGGSKLGD